MWRLCGNNKRGRQDERGAALTCVLQIFFLVSSILLLLWGMLRLVAWLSLQTLCIKTSDHIWQSSLPSVCTSSVSLSQMPHLLLIKLFLSCLAFYRFFFPPTHVSVPDRFAVGLAFTPSCTSLFSFISLALSLFHCLSLPVSSIWFDPLCSVEVGVRWKVLLKYTADGNKEIMNWLILNAILREYASVYFCVSIFLTPWCPNLLAII